MRSLLLAASVLMLNISAAQSEDAYACKLFAREYLRIVYIHNLKIFGNEVEKNNPNNTTADTTKLPFYYKKLIATCLASNKIPNLPDFPETADNAWLEDLVNSHMSKALGSVMESEPTQSSVDETISVKSSLQSKALATCNKVHMKVAWTNNGRSWRCIK